MANATANPWDIKVGGSGGGGDYVACPAGSHRGTIVGIYHIGHQTEQSQEKGQVEVDRLVLVFELTKKKADGSPFILSRRVTRSMHKKSTLYGDVTSILGRQLKDGERFDPTSILGVPVMVSVTNTENGDKKYHNVAAISQYPEDFPVPEPTIHPVLWTVATGEPFPDVDYLPFVYGKSIKDMAESSMEAKERAAEKTPFDDRF